MPLPIITYCTNIHPARGMDAVRNSLDQFSLPLKSRLSPDRPFPLGLRLSDEESRELCIGDELPRFRDWLTERGFTIACINGFPFGPFHGGPVKDDVHRPDWRNQERVDYTIRLAHILSQLPHAGAHAGISTSPLSYKPWGETTKHDRTHMTANIATGAIEFARLSQTKNLDLHLDIEPEPDGLLETAAEHIEWFNDELVPLATNEMARQLGLSTSDAENEVRKRIAVCLDTCHSAIEFEEPEATIDAYINAGVRIGRVQVSSALLVPIPADPKARASVCAALEPFADSTYLHQTIGRHSDGSTFQWPDLPEALAQLNESQAEEWRIHFHVPIFHAGESPLLTTQPQTERLIRYAIKRNACDIFEAETYTWSVLPKSLQFEMVDSIERELQWLHSVIESVAASPDKSP